VYGKSYESMYEGSMVGAGINVFAVWNYIITKNRCGYIEINPKLLAMILGGEESEVVSALNFLQKPDPASRSKAEQGRRIIKEGQFQYRVVNWEYYQRIRNEADRREYNRVKQRQYRQKHKTASGPLAGETPYVRAAENGASQEELDRMSDPKFATETVIDQ
jgi:hypothetical protein